jgi:hypothetical protein
MRNSSCQTSRGLGVSILHPTFGRGFDNSGEIVKLIMTAIFLKFKRDGIGSVDDYHLVSPYPMDIHQVS